MGAAINNFAELMSWHAEKRFQVPQADTFRSYVMQKMWIIFDVCSILCGMLRLLPSAVVWSFPVSKIQSTCWTYLRIQSLGSVSWSWKDGNIIKWGVFNSSVRKPGDLWLTAQQEERLLHCDTKRLRQWMKLCSFSSGNGAILFFRGPFAHISGEGVHEVLGQMT